MKLTNEQQELLKAASSKGEVFTIIGFNDIAQPFETKGRVTFNDKKQPGVYDDSVVFEFGKAKVEDGFRGETYTFFLTDMDDLNKTMSGTLLLVDKILDSNGNVVFANNDTPKYFKQAQEKAKKEQQKLESEGRDISDDVMDLVTKSLKDYIGKPIILGGRPSVLLGYGGASNNGSTMINEGIATLVGGGFINDITILKTIDLDGNRIVVASNRDNLKETREAFERRSDKIRQKEIEKTAQSEKE